MSTTDSAGPAQHSGAVIHPAPPDSEQPDSAESLAVKLEKLKFYRSEIQHEFNLLANRVSSYITSQSFLLIGFATSMGNMNPRWGPLFRLLFPLALASLGLTTSILVWPGIKGAYDTIELWRDKQERLFASDPRLEDYRVERLMRRSAEGRSIDVVHERSLLFARWSPWVFTIAWCVFGTLALMLSLME